MVKEWPETPKLQHLQAFPKALFIYSPEESAQTAFREEPGSLNPLLSPKKWPGEGHSGHFLFFSFPVAILSQDMCLLNLLGSCSMNKKKSEPEKRQLTQIFFLIFQKAAKANLKLAYN